MEQNPRALKSDLLTRWGQLKAERASWFMHWSEITTYVLPRNGRYFVQDRNRGQRRHNAIYDNTATRALDTLGAGLMGGLTSPARPWFRLGTTDPDLAKIAPVKLWLAQCTRIMLDIFARSNTYRVLHQMYKELGAFGTSAAIVVEDYDNVIHLFPLTVGEYALATDWRGNVCTMFREFQKTVGEVVKEFGLANCSETVKSLYESRSLDKWVTIIHAIEPRADRDPSKLDAENMAWRSIYFEQGGNPDKPLRDSGYKRFPVLAPRWEVAGGDIYGNSPGMAALGDVKQLQQEQLRKSQGIDYQTMPPLQVPTALKNRDVERLPGGVTYVDGTSKVESLFNVQLDLRNLLADIQDVRMRIDSAFYADLFRMLSSQPADGRMTATEVAERHEEKMLMIGPVLERLHNELLSPLIDITFDRMMEAGIAPPPPAELQGQALNVELISVLAQAQRAIATNSVDRFVMSMGTVAQFKPDVLDKFDADAWADSYSEMLGVDPEILVDDDTVAAVRKQRAQVQAQAQQAAINEQRASTAQKLANAPTQNGNALQDVMNQFAGYTGASP